MQIKGALYGEIMQVYNQMRDVYYRFRLALVDGAIDRSLRNRALERYVQLNSIKHRLDAKFEEGVLTCK